MILNSSKLKGLFVHGWWIKLTQFRILKFNEWSSLQTIVSKETPWKFSDLEFLYISPSFIEDCPYSPPSFSTDQLEMIDKYQAMIDRGEQVPPPMKIPPLPLAPDTWNPENPFDWDSLYIQTYLTCLKNSISWFNWLILHVKITGWNVRNYWHFCDFRVRCVRGEMKKRSFSP